MVSSLECAHVGQSSTFSSPFHPHPITPSSFYLLLSNTPSLFLFQAVAFSTGIKTSPPSSNAIKIFLTSDESWEMLSLVPISAAERDTGRVEEGSEGRTSVWPHI